ASPILEPAPHALDEIAGPVGLLVVGQGCLARGGGRYHCLGVPVGQQLAEMVGVIAPVGDQAADWTRGSHQGGGHGDVIDIAGRQQQHAGAADVIGKTMYLAGLAATRAAYRLDEGPPFPPAAERCALMWVLSMAAVP